ncbi:MAG: hypothetical protein LIP16_18095, partial [Clostridium sp.]|nr:hypothetical protein [Clostridium sp.]
CRQTLYAPVRFRPQGGKTPSRIVCIHRCIPWISANEGGSVYEEIYYGCIAQAYAVKMKVIV